MPSYFFLFFNFVVALLIEQCSDSEHARFEISQPTDSLIFSHIDTNLFSPPQYRIHPTLHFPICPFSYMFGDTPGFTASPIDASCSLDSKTSPLGSP